MGRRQFSLAVLADLPAFTEPVLQALGSSAPPVLSKAARKALSSFRSAGKR